MTDTEKLLNKSIEKFSELLEHSEGRIDRTNKMVFQFAQSVDNLREVIAHLESEYTTHIDRLSKRCDKVQEMNVILTNENVAMRKQLTELHRELLSTIREISKQPTISNHNIADQ